MPSHESSFSPKRPGFSSRHSSSTIQQHSRSSSDHLSSSAQKQKNPRHLVGHSRMGHRVPSYGKNVNKLAKLGAPPPPQDSPTSPRLNQTKRNSSNQVLLQAGNHTNLRKNQSETSLAKKRNRSSKDLSKLTRPPSSKNLTKADKKNSASSKRNSSSNQLAAPEVDNPTVRFDLGDEEDEQDDDVWVEESACQSPATTRSNTRPSSRMSDRDHSLEENTHVQLKPPTPQTPPRIPSSMSKTPITPDTPESEHSDELKPSQSSKSLENGRTTERDGITSRLLSRNVSSNATSQVSSVSARGHDASSSQNHSQDINDGDLVSRFINPGSSSGTPREPSFLPPNSQSNDENATLDISKRSKSSRSITDTSNMSGTSTPVALPPSRTQQKLWLDRASIIMEQQQQPKRPPNLLATGRFPSSGVPFQAMANDGTVHPQLKPLFDQINLEYRRVRIFQHPVADAITRLRSTGEGPRSKPVNKTKPGSSATTGDGDKFGLSQSLKSSKSGKASTSEVRKPKVMFQGIKGSKDDGEVNGRQSLDENDFGQESPPLDDAREICRRMWDQNAMLANDDS